MEDFIEQVVVRRKNASLYALLYGFCWLLVAALGIFSLTQLTQIGGATWEETNWTAVCLFAAGGLAAFLVYRLKEYLRTEYEYAFTAGELDIDRVLGNTRRKHVLTVRLRDVEAGGRTEGEKYQNYCSMPGLKKVNYALNTDQPLRYLYFVSEGKRFLMLLEPNEELWEAIAASNPGIEA